MVLLSLPENWDYTLKGLSLINRESIDAIRTAVWELEKAGYITRQQNRDGKGKMADMVYTIYEQPQPRPEAEDEEQPGLENPVLENPTSDNPTSENPVSGYSPRRLSSFHRPPLLPCRKSYPLTHGYLRGQGKPAAGRGHFPAFSAAAHGLWYLRLCGECSPVLLPRGHVCPSFWESHQPFHPIRVEDGFLRERLLKVWGKQDLCRQIGRWRLLVICCRLQGGERYPSDATEVT